MSQRLFVVVGNNMAIIRRTRRIFSSVHQLLNEFFSNNIYAYYIIIGIQYTYDAV